MSAAVETPGERRPVRPALTVAICILITVLEGIDIQSIGVAAPRLVPEFGLSQSASGLLFSASLVGLFLGAIVGGRLSDRIGRKRVLAGSVFLFGLFSLSTVIAWDLPSLVATRLLTGIGLGGAMPNLIALVSENSPPRWSKSLTTLVWIGTPAGGMIAAQIAANTSQWRDIFIAGGVAPLLMTPVILALLPESPAFRREAGTAAPRHRVAEVLFGEGRAGMTLLLWGAFFSSLILLHLLLNWLPLLVLGQGFEKPVAALSATWFNIGGCIGSLLFAISLGLLPTRGLLAVIYAGMAMGLVGLASVAGGVDTMLLAAAAAGFFVIGGQFVLYGLAPTFYPPAIRGTGVGAAVGAGRLGSVLGPIIVGVVLAAGFSIPQLLTGLAPVAAIAGLAIIGALTLARRHEAAKATGVRTPR